MVKTTELKRKTWYVMDSVTEKKFPFPSELDCAYFINMVNAFFPEYCRTATELYYYWEE